MRYRERTDTLTQVSIFYEQQNSLDDAGKSTEQIAEKSK